MSDNQRWGLKTSAYLLDTAKEHIEGKIDIDEAQNRIFAYYEERKERSEIEDEAKEADIVSARIAKLLGEKNFQFSPAEWLSIHRRLFEGVFVHATTKYLEEFYSNLLMGTEYELKNRYMHVDFQSAKMTL